MAEKRKLKKKGKNDAALPTTNAAGPSKLEKAVANYMRKHVPIKTTRFLNHQVNYFNANKAIDVLLDSTWATGKEPIFTDRESVVDFGNKLLVAKFFHRARKLAVTDKDLTPKELKRKQERQKRKEKKGEDTGTETPNKEEEENQEEKDKQKKKRTKIKLDMHLDQVFLDSTDAYVWMYDPVPFWYFIAGGCLLFAAVAVCLFPLWPPIVRNGVYYLCVAAAGFLGFILGLAVLRLIVFVIIWTLSFGRHHLWILPNLTEDVGFFASFWPLYQYEYKGDAFDKKNKSKKKQIVQDEEVKKSDDEDIPDPPLEENDEDQKCNSGPETAVDETDSSEVSNSQTFEMVNEDDIPIQETSE